MKAENKKKVENTYIAPPLGKIIKWWKNSTTSDAIGGSFNHDLYIQYLKTISE